MNRKPKPELYKDLSRDNPKHAKVFRFIDEYCVDMNGTQAAIRAGYSEKSARQQAQQLLSNLYIKKEIDKTKSAIAERNNITIDDLVAQWKAIAYADIRKLVSVTYKCCRFCYGVGFQYQFTPAGMREARVLHQQNELNKMQSILGYQVKEFDTEGGSGFDGTLDPHPDCPECCGRGKLTLEFGDLNKLTLAECATFAGAAMIGGNIRLFTLDRLKALDALSRYVGFYDAHENSVGAIPSTEFLIKNYIDDVEEYRKANEELMRDRKKMLEKLDSEIDIGKQFWGGNS